MMKRKRPPAQRQPYPSTISDEEWGFVAPYLTLAREDAPQRQYLLRAVYNALRWMGPDRRAVALLAQRFSAVGDGVSTNAPESGAHAGSDGAKKRKGSKAHMVVDTLGHLLALRVTAANEQERAQVDALAVAVQEVTGDTVELAFVDQGYTGTDPAAAAAAHGIRLDVVKLPEAKRGFVLLPRRWVVERSFGWLARCRRLARDYERLPQTLAGLHFIACAYLLLHRAVSLFTSS